MIVSSSSKVPADDYFSGPTNRRIRLTAIL